MDRAPSVSWQRWQGWDDGSGVTYSLDYRDAEGVMRTRDFPASFVDWVAPPPLEYVNRSLTRIEDGILAAGGSIRGSEQ